MIPPPEIANLGPRICIIGPSSSGKSSLATALGARLAVRVVHLDLLAHYPDTQWQPRPKSEFVALHDAELPNAAWIIEGNFSVCMPQRFARATAIIWLDFDRWGCLWRYFRRTLQPASARKGVLPGSVERLNWRMVQFIVWKQPRNRGKYERMLEDYDLPKLRLRSMRELQACYQTWNL